MISYHAEEFVLDQFKYSLTCYVRRTQTIARKKPPRRDYVTGSVGRTATYRPLQRRRLVSYTIPFLSLERRSRGMNRR